MEFTKEQFEEIGPWYFNDLCFKSDDQEVMRKIFNLLPSHLQGQAISWGCDDSVFRDDVYEYLLGNQFGMKVEEYVKSEIGKNFFENGVYQEINFELLKPRKLIVDLETGGFNGDNHILMYDGDTAEKITLSGKEVQSKLDEMLEETKDGYVKGELGIIMAPPAQRKTWDPSKGRYQEKIQRAIDRNKKKDTDA